MKWFSMIAMLVFQKKKKKSKPFRIRHCMTAGAGGRFNEDVRLFLFTKINAKANVD